MQLQIQTTLETFYENWQGYQQKMRDCIAPLTPAQLRLRPAPGMRSLQELAQHIIAVRAGWFSGILQEYDEAMLAYSAWGEPDSPERSAAQLARGLDETWAFIERRLQRWTEAELTVTFPNEWNGRLFELPRSWVIYHIMEHDLHHGGELSLILGMNGLPPIEI